MLTNEQKALLASVDPAPEAKMPWGPAEKHRPLLFRLRYMRGLRQGSLVVRALPGRTMPQAVVVDSLARAKQIRDQLAREGVPVHIEAFRGR